MTPPGDLLGAAIASGATLAILGVAELWARTGSPKPEWTRKLVHIGGGIACLAFPWLFRSPWVVLALAASLAGLFALGSWFGFLKSLHSVSRSSRGSEYFPLAIFLTFVLADGRPWLYVASVLVLVVSDAMAGLIGSRYGRIRYEVDGDEKSLEGSLAFLVSAFVAIAGVLFGMTDLPPAVALLSAALVAAVATLFEAVSLRGADNLFLPVLVCVVLTKITSKDLGAIVEDNLALAGILAVVGGTAYAARLFNVGATLALALFAFASYTLGTRVWALPFFTGFAFYVACRLATPLPQGESGGVKVRALYRALLLPFAALALANFHALHGRIFGPFLAAGTAVVSFALWNHFLHVLPCAGWKRRSRAVVVSVAAWAAIVLPVWAALHGRGASFLAALAVGAVAAAVAVADDILVGPDPAFDFRNRRWPASSYILTLVATVLTVALQEKGLIPAWPL